MSGGVESVGGTGMLSLIQVYLLCFFVVSVTIGGDYLLVLAARNLSDFSPLVFAGGGMYFLTAIGWLYIFRNTSISSAAILYSAMTTVLLILMGKFVFGQVIGTRNMVAAALALSSILIADG